MEIAFLPQATEDLQYWKQTGNIRVLKRIREPCLLTFWSIPLRV